MLRLLLSVMLALISTQGSASSWHCRNSDLEIHCDSDTCKTSDGFTPFDIHINAGGALSICAYSGCWDGRGKVLKSGKHLLVSGNRLKRSGTHSSTADFMVAIDIGDQVGFVKGEGFAMPITCTQQHK